MPKEDIAGLVRHWRYTPDDRYLANPHRGCCTFQRFNGDPLYDGAGWTEAGPVNGALSPAAGATGVPGYFAPAVTPGFLPTTVAYCRWFWEKLEPSEGVYDFSMIDKALDACRQRGQTLALRLMPFGAAYVGQAGLPDWYIKKYPTQKWHATDMLAPVYDAPGYFERFGGLIAEFARRYDAHPLLETVDVAFLGPWGEGDGVCSQARVDQFAELYRRAFQHTPRLALIGGGGGAAGQGDQLRAGIAHGSGWRADCFGDLRQKHNHPAPLHMIWNHMYNLYPKRICEVGAQDAWKTAPVHFEVCEVPMDWYRQEFDIDFIIEQGWKYHTTYFMPKSSPLPEAWMDKLAAFCNKLGYRFVFRQATLSRRTARGGKFVFRAWIENTGAAPLYRRYDFALRLQQGDAQEVIVLEDVNPCQWLPGDIWLDREIDLPRSFQSGYIELSAGLLDRRTHQPGVNFAVRERFADRWMLLGGVEVV